MVKKATALLPGPSSVIAIQLLLRLQLRFVRSNERANVGRHVQQLQPLFFVQRHGKSSHPIDRDCSLFADLHAETGRCPLLEGRVFFAQTLKLIFRVFVRHGWSSFSATSTTLPLLA